MRPRNPANAYDNSVREADYVLASLIRMLKDTSGKILHSFMSPTMANPSVKAVFSTSTAPPTGWRPANRPSADGV